MEGERERKAVSTCNCIALAGSKITSAKMSDLCTCTLYMYVLTNVHQLRSDIQG